MPLSRNSAQIRGTTVLCLRRNKKVMIAADGQITMGEHVMKHMARKTRQQNEAGALLYVSSLNLVDANVYIRRQTRRLIVRTMSAMSIVATRRTG